MVQGGLRPLSRLEFTLLFLLGVSFVEPWLLIEMKTQGLGVAYFGYVAAKNLGIGLVLIEALRNTDFSKPLNRIIYPALLGVLLIAAVLGMMNSEVAKGNIVISIKNIWIWLILLIGIACSDMRIEKRLLMLLAWIAVLGGVLNTLVSIWTKMTYSGDSSQFYFYELFRSMDMFMEFNYIRNGSVRGFGLLASCLSLSQLLILPVSIVLAPVLSMRRFAALGVLVILLAGLVMTQTRNPLLALIVSVGAFFVWKITKKFVLVVVYDIAYMVFAFYWIWHKWLTDHQSIDLSAIDRILQFNEILERIIARPWGFGLGYAGVANNNYVFMTDLSFGTYLLDLGIVSTILIYVAVFGMIHSSLQLGFASGSDASWRKWTGTVVFLVGNSLILLTEFSNIFDQSLFAYAVFLGVAYRWLGQASHGQRVNS